MIIGNYETRAKEVKAVKCESEADKKVIKAWVENTTGDLSILTPWSTLALQTTSGEVVEVDIGDWVVLMSPTSKHPVLEVWSDEDFNYMFVKGED